MMDVRQITMLFTLNLHGAASQLHLNKTGREKNGRKREIIPSKECSEIRKKSHLKLSEWLKHNKLPCLQDICMIILEECSLTNIFQRCYTVFL